VVSGRVQGELFVAVKLKDHRLKPGGVPEVLAALFVARKLKDHRLKPGGVPEVLAALFVARKLKDHRLKPGGVLVVIKQFNSLHKISKFLLHTVDYDLTLMR